MQVIDYHLGDILGVVAGVNLPPRGMEGVRDIMSFMTETHLGWPDLPITRNKCRSYLLELHPQLKEVDASKVNEKNCKEWLDEQVKKYGEYLSVKPISMMEAEGAMRPI